MGEGGAVSRRPAFTSGGAQRRRATEDMPNPRARKHLEGASESGIAGRLRGTSAVSWSGGPFLTDPARLDGALQLAVLWTKKMLEGASLPTRIGALALYSDLDSTETLNARVSGETRGRDKVVTSIALWRDDELVAELTDVETILLPS